MLANNTLAADRPRNVVVIYGDDVGIGDLGCYGATRVATPNVDWLAREGALVHFQLCDFVHLHDGFAQGNQPKVMAVTIVWYDGQAGSTWKLDYDAGAQTMKTALSSTGKGDKQWHHEVVMLNDAVFRRGGAKGADLPLVNTDAKDDIFSLIEVHCDRLETPPLRPPTDFKVSNEPPRPPKAVEANKPEDAR